MEQDIRWEQRFANYVKALHKLTQSIDYIKNNFTNRKRLVHDKDFVLDEMLREGLIQRFEYTHELAWNVMKDYAIYQGNSSIGGSRDASREAFQLQLIADVWMDMISSRNKTLHTYNEETAEEIFSKILEEYYPAFIAFKDKMEEKRSQLHG